MRVGERERGSDLRAEGTKERRCVCVCVCVCMSICERERERARGRDVLVQGAI